MSVEESPGAVATAREGTVRERPRRRRRRGELHGSIKPTVFALCLLPAGWLLWDALTGGLGVNPIEEITHRTGDWALKLLLLTLAVTPLRRISGWSALLRLRRMLGLFAFFYALLHFATWLVLDQFFDWQAILADIAKRPYITLGFSAFLLLVPLAVTSTDGMLRRLGRNWLRLHRLIYPAAVLAVAHFWWLVKADLLEPAVYAGLLALLLVLRLPPISRRLARRGPTSARPVAGTAPGR